MTTAPVTARKDFGDARLVVGFLAFNAIFRLVLLNINQGEYTDGILQIEPFSRPNSFWPPLYTALVWLGRSVGLDAEGFAHVEDWGIARYALARSADTTLGQERPAPYLAPEQVREAVAVFPRTLPVLIILAVASRHHQNIVPGHYFHRTDNTHRQAVQYI